MIQIIETEMRTDHSSMTLARASNFRTLFMLYQKSVGHRKLAKDFPTDKAGHERGGNKMDHGQKDRRKPVPQYLAVDPRGDKDSKKLVCQSVVGAIFICAAVQGTTTHAQTADELAKQLSNPIASLTSVPFQGNFDFGGGPTGDGFGFTLNVQPVVPISLNDDWTLISRTIIPLSYRDYAVAPDTDISGIGDITQSFFFSPSRSVNGLTWGVGPVFLFPTASDDQLGGGKFGLGLTGVVLKQSGPWTVGALANHIWSVSGDSARADISNTFFQPFVSYALGKGQTISMNVEGSYNWYTDQATIPVNIAYSKVFKAGDQLMSFAVGAKYYADGPAGVPDWGVRTTLTLLFP